MSLPLFAIELARDRLNPTHLVRATMGAEVFEPHAAVEAGWIDRVVPVEDCEAEAIAEARRLGQYVSAAYAQTKRALRQPVADRVRAGAALDRDSFMVETPS
jgi:enoyl-CoA hydratase